MKIGSLNIRGGLYSKEHLIKQTIEEHDLSIIGLHEVDIEDFDETKPFTIKGYRTYFHKRNASMKRMLCLVREDIEATERDDLMCEDVASVWL